MSDQFPPAVSFDVVSDVDMSSGGLPGSVDEAGDWITQLKSFHAPAGYSQL